MAHLGVPTGRMQAALLYCKRDPEHLGVEKKGYLGVAGAPKREGGGNVCVPRALSRTGSHPPCSLQPQDAASLGEKETMRAKG